MSLRLADVYGEVKPHYKLALVEWFQGKGRVVTGDGIDDARALAKAEVGIAMSTRIDDRCSGNVRELGFRHS